jgi:hypothetical protein
MKWSGQTKAPIPYGVVGLVKPMAMGLLGHSRGSHGHWSPILRCYENRILCRPNIKIRIYNMEGYFSYVRIFVMIWYLPYKRITKRWLIVLDGNQIK